MSIVETEVEKPAAQGAAMEITVSAGPGEGAYCDAERGGAQNHHSDPVELSHRGRRRRLNIRPGPGSGHPYQHGSESQEGGRVHHFRRASCLITLSCCPTRHFDQAAREPLGADSRRPLEHQNGRHGARQLSASARFSCDCGYSISTVAFKTLIARTISPSPMRSRATR